MTDRENDFQNRSGQSRAQDSEGRQVQQELERQLRELGDTMSDAFRHGFEGRGEELGDRVWDVGRAAANAASYGISEAGRAFQAGKQQYQKRAEEARNAAPSGENAGGMPGWAPSFFAKKPVPTPIDDLRTSAKKRHNAGVAMLATGITFAVLFGITAIACFGTAGMFASGSAAGAADMTVLGAIGEFAMSATRATGWCSAAVTAVFGWLTAAGASRMKAAKTLELYADTAEGFDWHKGLSLSMLAELTHKKKAKALRLLRKFIHKGWLSAWMDEKNDKLYLTAEDYRTAQENQPEPEPEKDTAFPVGNLLMVAAVALVGGGAVYYFKVYRPKHEAAGLDEDDYDYDEADPYGDMETEEETEDEE